MSTLQQPETSKFLAEGLSNTEVIMPPLSGVNTPILAESQDFFESQEKSSESYLWAKDTFALCNLLEKGGLYHKPGTKEILETLNPVDEHIIIQELSNGKYWVEEPDEYWVTATAYMLQAKGIPLSQIQVLAIGGSLLEYTQDDEKINQIGLMLLPVESLVSPRPFTDWEGDLTHDLSPREAAKIAQLIITVLEPCDRIQANIALDLVRKRAGMSEYTWDKKYVSEIRASLERALLKSGKSPLSERRKQDLQNLAQEKDPDKFIDDRIAFCRRYGWNRREVDQRIAQLKAVNTKPQAKRLTGESFISLETESMSWVFPGIIPSRGVSIIGGNPGVGKTTLAYDAAGSFLLNEEFLGEKPTKPGKVLIVTGDELPCFTQDKIINRGFPLENWDIVLNWDTSQWDVLEEAIKEVKPSLIIVDSFSSIHRDPNFDENSAQAKATVYDLEALTNTYGCGCFLIHHLSKSKDNKGVAKLRGSSAIAAAASVVCLMEETSTGSRKLSFPKVRGAQTEPFVVELDEPTGRYKVILGGDKEETKSLGERILELLTQSPHKRFEQVEISEALGIPPQKKDSVYQALGRLFKRGLITKRPSGTGKRNKVYGISNPYKHVPKDTCDNKPEVESIKIEGSPPSTVENVSVRKSITIEITESQTTNTLTESKINTLLTTSNEQKKVNPSIPCTEEVSVELTGANNQGGVYAEESESQADISELAQEEITSGAELAQSDDDEDQKDMGEIGKTYLVYRETGWVEAVLVDAPNPPLSTGWLFMRDDTGVQFPVFDRDGFREVSSD